MQSTVHATRRTPRGASCLVQAKSAWLVKTRRAPSRHSRHVRVDDHKTTVMHKLSTPPPTPLTLQMSVDAVIQIMATTHNVPFRGRHPSRVPYRAPHGASRSMHTDLLHPSDGLWFYTPQPCSITEHPLRSPSCAMQYVHGRSLLHRPTCCSFLNEYQHLISPSPTVPRKG